ncbi:transcription factor bHLH35 [Olea europaea subsp. europaea]|uniref:Transcription factor bHLH35 n=1 Tax=Olea europaea subsp. europaea TaxID=158383 RepID=A0A8S0PAS0_OLEEU|nr:transcription factor bHLH35 [Olea europaea subsp. europaea]
MHKESIVKDAIDYIQKLHEEERKIQAEISDLESAGSSSKSTISEFDHEETFSSNPKRVTSESFYDSGGSRSSPIEVLEADEKEKDLLKIKIETAIAALNAP